MGAIDLKLADPVGRPVLSRVFGESKAHKRKRAETIKALNSKKCMLINAFVLPTDPESLLAFTQLAHSLYKTSDNEMVRNAWKGKMILGAKKLRTLILDGEADALADEFLFLSEEIEKIQSAEE